MPGYRKGCEQHLTRGGKGRGGGESRGIRRAGLDWRPWGGKC